MNRPHTAPEAPLSLLLIRHGVSGSDPLLEYLLEQEFRLSVADSAELGMTLFEQELPDMTLICAHRLLDPFDLARNLRERWGCRSHTVIIGGGNHSDAWKLSFEAGAAAYLPAEDDLGELAITLQRLQERLCSCRETSRELIEATRTTRLLDTLPWGIILISSSGQLILCNRTATNLTGLPPRGIEQRVDDLFLKLYGLERDASLVQLRTAMHSGTAWQDTIYCGQNNYTLQLELIPLQTVSSPQGLHLLTVQELGSCPTSQPYLTLLSAAALDLLQARHLSAKEQARLTTAITEGILPGDDRFGLEQLLHQAFQLLPGDTTRPEQSLPDYLALRYYGNSSLIGQILAALLGWAEGVSGTRSGIRVAVALQGRDSDRHCLRFSVAAPDRRLARSSYQRGDEALARQIALGGISSLTSLRGIGLASLLAALLGSSLVIRQVAREGRTALFDLWLRIADDTGLQPDQPARPAQPAQTPHLWQQTGSGTGHGGPLRILAAEDNPLEQANLSRLMERLGHQLVLVGNGREAVEECEQADFDLILMDILMPVMDGFEAVRLIREQERVRGGHTPVIALTSYALQAVQERCAKAGMDGYLSKPVTQAKVEELAQALFAGTQPMAKEEPTPAAAKTAAPCPTQETGLPVLDLQEAMINLGADLSFFREMLTLFTTHGKPLLDELAMKLQTAETDGGMLERDAHKLKGMANNIGALQLADLCERIQHAAPLEDLLQRQQYRQELNRAAITLFATLEQLDWQALKEQYG